MNQFSAAFLVILCCIEFHGSGQASAQQPLSEKLLAENVTSLAAAARGRGDAVNGAILFAQKSLACATCHAQGRSDLIGPDLTRIKPNQKDEHFVESLLQPSKAISEGFDSVKILTTDGRLISARVLRDEKDRLVIREITGTKNRMVLTEEQMVLTKEQIERIEQDPVSAMPNNLVDQLHDRQQFLDLVRYIMDIAGTAGGMPLPGESTLPRQATDQERLDGLALLDQFGCMQCHAAGADQTLAENQPPGKRGPSLAAAATRIDPAYLRRFLSEPHLVKPGTSMPDVMHFLDEQDRAAKADAITHYLLSLAKEPFRRQPADTAAAERGRLLFHEVGCVACHSPRDEYGWEVAMDDSVPLGDLRGKYNLDGLSAFLEDPHAIRPSGRMPNMKLTHWEAIDLANYLLSGAADGAVDEPVNATVKADHQLALLGRQSFEQLGCASCHATGDGTTSQRNARPLTQLNTERGCLSPPRDQPSAQGQASGEAEWPRYALSEMQREAMRVAIARSREPLSDRDQIVRTLKTLRCTACHRRDDLGGIPEDRDSFFHTTNENLGPQGRIPPPLTGVGGKLKPKWLREVLVSGRAIRPYMKTRMPQYGSENVSHLVDLFARVDPKPLVAFPDTGDPKETRKIGTELVGNGGLNCIACHTFQQQPAQTMPAVDLTEMAERLHKEWFFQYMLSPQTLSPGTVMPSFWPGGKAIRKEIAGGDSNLQIGSIWEYLLDGRQARAPRGLRREPIELLATEGHAVLLRRSYREIGKRGIGVGYPGGVNLAFDAEQMRLAMIWKGKFADPAGVWRSQGHGTVRPLGTDLIRFEAGPDLDDVDSPWTIDTGRPPDHQFKGYFLDEIGRPTFLYRFQQIDVEDRAINFRESDSSPTILKRSVKWSAKRPRSNLVFRVADGDQIARIDPNMYQVGNNLRIHIASGHDAKIVQTQTGARLIVPLDVPAGTTEMVVDYIW